MTLDNYNNLPIDEQEKFINNGGIITLPTQVNGVFDETIATTHKGTPMPQLAIKSPSITQESVTPLSNAGEQLVGSSGVVLFPEVKESSVRGSPPTSFSTDTFDIQDPVELLYLLDDNISSGKVTLHKWQIQFLLDFAVGGATDEHPFQSVVRACNGSGKDKYIIAPAAVWLCMRYKRARCVITSSSGVQLDNQTCAYIEQLCLSANRKFGPIWKCNYRYYECLATESPMICYATDEPGKAEGFHPLEYGAKMAILVSEDKTVPDEINVALNKCTGYTHRCHVSTPGNAFGHFFDLCSTAVPRTALKDVNETRPEDYLQYHIKGANIGKNDEILPGDCPHLHLSYVKQMARDLPGGLNGSAFKSQVLAEFGTTDEMVVIPYTYVWKCSKFTELQIQDRWVREPHNKAGLDLSDGGAETVLFTRNGNKALKLIPFRFDNTEDTVKFLEGRFEENGLTDPDAYIFGDAIGIGKPILDRLKRRGWSNIRYVDSRRVSTRPKVYRNWNAEAWFNFASLLTNLELILINDPLLIKQLTTRYYKIVSGVHQLLSKLEQRSRGYPSPDRADACVLSFTDYKSTFVEKADESADKPFEAPEVKKVTSDFVLKSWAKGDRGDYDLGKWNVNNGQKDFSDLADEISDYNRKLVNK